jgi:hypothetical protein
LRDVGFDWQWEESMDDGPGDTKVESFFSSLGYNVPSAYFPQELFVTNCTEYDKLTWEVVASTFTGARSYRHSGQSHGWLTVPPFLRSRWYSLIWWDLEIIFPAVEGKVQICTWAVLLFYCTPILTRSNPMGGTNKTQKTV